MDQATVVTKVEGVVLGQGAAGQISVKGENFKLKGVITVDATAQIKGELDSKDRSFSIGGGVQSPKTNGISINTQVKVPVFKHSTKKVFNQQQTDKDEN